MPISSGDYAMEIGYEGAICSSDLNSQYVGTQDGYVNGLTVPLPFGRFVTLATVVPASVGLPVLGQTCLGFAPVNNRFMRQSSQPNGYPVRYPVPIVRKGIVLVRVESSVLKYQPVAIRHTDFVTGFNARGRVRNDTDGGRASFVPIANIRPLDTATVAGQIIRVEIDFPIQGVILT